MVDKGKSRDSNGNSNGNTGNNLQSTLDTLRKKGVTIGLVDGRLKYQGDISRATKDELKVIKANRETLCLLLEIESTTCGDDDKAENKGECEDAPGSDDKSKPESHEPVTDLGITPNMSQSEIQARINQHNEGMRQEREELAAKRRDRSLIEVSLGVFRSREEVEKENRTYIFELPNRKNGMRMIAARGQVNYGNQSLLESQLDQFRDWTESQWREKD